MSRGNTMTKWIGMLLALFASPALAGDGDFHTDLVAGNTGAVQVGIESGAPELYAVLTEDDPFAAIRLRSTCVGAIRFDGNIDGLGDTDISATAYECPNENWVAADTGEMDIDAGVGTFVRQDAVNWVDAAGGSYAAGDYVVATGFSNWANNGIFRVTSLSTTTMNVTVVDGATMVADVSGANHRIRRIADLDHCSALCTSSGCALNGDAAAGSNATYGIESHLIVIHADLEPASSRVTFAAAKCQ
jgi:hypothetical protein